MTFVKVRLALYLFLIFLLLLFVVEYSSFADPSHASPSVWMSSLQRLTGKNAHLIRITYIVGLIALSLLRTRPGRQNNLGNLLGLIPALFLFLQSYVLVAPAYLLLQPLLLTYIWILAHKLHFRSSFSVRRSAFGIKNTRVKKENVYSFNWQIDSGFINIENPFQGIFITGGAGSGKTYSVIEEVIRQAVAKDYTGFVYDYKFPELNDVLRAALASKNKQDMLISLDFGDASNSARINPLEPSFMLGALFAGQYASTVLMNLKREWVHKPDFWADNAISFLKAIIWYLKINHPACCTLPHAVALSLSNYSWVLQMLAADPACKPMIISLVTAFEQNASAQLAGCISSLQTPIEKLNDPGLFWILSGKGVSLELNSPNRPQFLVAGNYPALSEAYSPVIALIASVILKKMNQRNRLKSIFLLDEAPTLYIPQLKELPNTGRSNLISTIYCCQDYSQMDVLYGAEEARAIRASLGNQFIGMVNDVATAEQVSRIFGKGDKLVENRNWSRSSPADFFSDASYSKGVSGQIVEKDLITASTILSLSPGEFVGKTTSTVGPFFHGTIQVPGKSNCPVEQKLKTLYPSSRIQDNFEKIHQDAQHILDAGCVSTVKI